MLKSSQIPTLEEYTINSAEKNNLSFDYLPCIKLIINYFIEFIKNDKNKHRLSQQF